MPTLKVAIDARGGEVGASQFQRSGEKIVRTSRDIDREVGKASAEITSFGGSASRVLRGVASAALATTAAVQGIRVFASFEEGLVTLGGVARATEEQFARLDARAQQLGITTRFSAREASDGLLFLARAGFSADEALAAIGDTLNLAATSGLTLGEASDVASNVLSQFSLDAAETVRVVDSLTNVANNANTDVRQLAQALVFAGPQAGAFGQSVEQTSAALGVLGDAGIQATLAGTNLRGIISTLIDPTTKGAAAIDRLGISLSELNPATNDLISIFRRLREANLGAAEATQIFGLRNVGAALILSQSAERVAELVGLQEELRGETERLAILQNNTLLGSFRALRSAAEGYAIAIGKGGAGGAVKEVVDFSTEVIRSLAGVEGELGGVSKSAAITADALRGATAALVAFGAASVITALTATAAGVTAVATAVRALNVAVRANPIGLLASAAAAAVAVFVDFGDEVDESARSLDGLTAAAERAEESARLLNGVVGRVASVRGALLRAFDLSNETQIAAGLERVRREFVNASEVLREDPAAKINFSDLLRADVPTLRGVFEKALEAVDFESLFAEQLDSARSAFASANDALSRIARAEGLNIFDSASVKRAAAANRELSEALLAQATAAQRLRDLESQSARPLSVLADLPNRDQIAVLEGVISELDRLATTQVAVAEQTKQVEVSFGGFRAAADLVSRAIDGARSAFNRLRAEQEIALIRSNQLTQDAVRGLEQENAVLSLLVEGRRDEAEFLRLRLRLQNEGVALTAAAEERLRGLVSENIALNGRLSETRERVDAVGVGLERWERPFYNLRESFEESIDPARQLEKLAIAAPQALARGLEEAVFSARSLNDVLSETLLALSRIGFQTFVSGPLAAFLGGLGAGASGTTEDSGLLKVFGANGLVSNAGRQERFALGGVPRGVIGSTVIFPMTNGKVGVAGEAGLEYAADPVRLPSGRLGVAVAGGGRGPVVVNIYARDLDGVNRRSARATARAIARGVGGP